MKFDRAQLSREERLFLEYLLQNRPFDSEPATLFHAIQEAFMNCGKIRDFSAFPVAPILISSLAACTWIALCYDKGEEIPWGNADHDYVLLKALRGLMQTAAVACREGNLNEIDGRPALGCLKLPEGFIEWAKKNEQ